MAPAYLRHVVRGLKARSAVGTKRAAYIVEDAQVAVHVARMANALVYVLATVCLQDAMTTGVGGFAVFAPPECGAIGTGAIGPGTEPIASRPIKKTVPDTRDVASSAITRPVAPASM